MKKTMKGGRPRVRQTIDDRGCANPPSQARPGACEGPGSVGPICMRSAATGRSSRPYRLSRAMRAWGTWRLSAPVAKMKDHRIARLAALK